MKKYTAIAALLAASISGTAMANIISAPTDLSVNITAHVPDVTKITFSDGNSAKNVNLVFASNSWSHKVLSLSIQSNQELSVKLAESPVLLDAKTGKQLTASLDFGKQGSQSSRRLTTDAYSVGNDISATEAENFQVTVGVQDSSPAPGEYSGKFIMNFNAVV